MAAKKSRPWEPRWQKTEQLGRGGQGITHLVTDRQTKEPGVLKVQPYGKAMSDPERRGRFRREAVALETLDHPRVPKLLSTNAEEHADPAVHLYMVQEFIPGMNLADHIEENGPLDVGQAVELTRHLLDVLAYCHAAEVGHRDLKPDNVMLRDGEPTEPVLVDFGQAFHVEDDEGPMITYDDQIMGNRFLTLPELTSGSGRRDFRSDLTQLAGVLFFAVTGILPRQLLDGGERPPHRRDDAAALLPAIEWGDLLCWFFDRAFRHAPDERFQDQREFGEALDYVAGGEELPLAAILAPGNMQLQSSALIKAKENFAPFRDTLAQLAQKAGKAVQGQVTGGGAHTIPGSIDTSWLEGSWSYQYGLGINAQPHLRTVLTVHVFHEGAKYQVRVHEEQGGEPLVQFDCSVFEPAIPPDFGARLTRVLAVKFAEVLQLVQ